MSPSYTRDADWLLLGGFGRFLLLSRRVDKREREVLRAVESMTICALVEMELSRSTIKYPPVHM